VRRLVAFAVAAACLVATPTASAATQRAQFVLSPGARFPERQFVLALPSGIKPFDLQVTENGIPVIPHLRPIGKNQVPLSLAILLDTSDSMRGRPLAAAEDAAETLITEKPARSEVAVFGFAETPYLVHGWSAQPSAFAGSLSDLKPSSGTAIWGAVGMASQSLMGRHGAARAVVLLTDGVDTERGATVSDAVDVARAAHAPVYVVGLPGAHLDRTNLRKLVAGSRGQFIQVRSLGELHQVYAGLAKELRQQFVLTYASQLRGTGRPVTVELRVAGLTARQHYTIPPIHTAAAPRAEGWWSTHQAIEAIAAGVGALVLVIAYLLARPKRANPVRRLRGYGIGAAAAPVEMAAKMPERPRRRAPRPGPSQVWGRFAADVDRGDLGRSPIGVLLLGMTGGTAAAVAAGLATGQPLAIAGGPVIGAIATWAYVTHRASAWYRRFDAVLPDALTVLASSLRAGHSLLQAVDHVAQEADEETAVEWKEVVRQTQLGIPVEDAIDEMTYRVGSKDLAWISVVARVQHQVGGNMAEMFDIVAETVRQRHRLRSQVHALTAQGRMTRWVLTIAPFALGGLLMLMSPNYINGFLDSHIGQAMIVIACCMIVIGSLWLKKIVEIEV
jgi:tight adherence protein B